MPLLRNFSSRLRMRRSAFPNVSVSLIEYGIVSFSPLDGGRPMRFAGDEGDAGDAGRVIPFFHCHFYALGVGYRLHRLHRQRSSGLEVPALQSVVMLRGRAA